MKGKILGAGAISAEDGGRYYYDEGEIKNLKSGQKLEGCEVDFDIKDGKAVMIYITKGSGFSVNLGGGVSGGANSASVSLPRFDSPHIFWDLGEAVANLFKVNMHSAKLWFLVLAVLNIFTAFNLIGSGKASGFVMALFIIISIVSFVLVLWTNFCLSTLSQSFKLLQYILIAMVSSAIFSWLIIKIFQSYFYAFMSALLGGGGGHPVFKIIFAIIFALVTIFFSFKYLSRLSKITGERAFLWSLFAGVGLSILEIILLFATYNERRPLQTLDNMQVCNVIIYFISMGLFVWATLRFRKVESVE